MSYDKVDYEMENSVRKHYKKVKKGIRKNLLADPFFTTKYSFSPYHACEHGCLYCDGRAERYWVQGDFEKDIIIRENMPEVLMSELAKLRERGTIAISSGVSDPYQPVEKTELVMRRCAEVISDFDFPVHLLTKSALALRDIDIWSKINQKSQVTLMVSLVFLDDRLRKQFEPQASSVEERIEMLTAFKEAGIDIALCAMPLLPHICDSEDQLDKLFSMAKEIGISHVLTGDLTLRPGSQKNLFMSSLADLAPSLVPDYTRLYRKELSSGAVDKSYHQSFTKLTNKLLARYELPQSMPHHVYKANFTLYDEIHILLHHMRELYDLRQINTNALSKAIKGYDNWLTAEKKIFNRKRSMHSSSLESKLRFMHTTGELEKILGNSKLASFLGAVIEDQGVFDYNNLNIAKQGKSPQTTTVISSKERKLKQRL